MEIKEKQKLYAWVVWLFGAIFLFYKYAIEVSPSVMTQALMSTFEIDGTKLGNLAASYFYAYLLMQIPAGLLIDKYGPKKVSALAILMCGVGSILFSFTDSFFLACLGRFLTGLGAAFSAINCLKLTANWFSFRRFAFMAGLMMTVGMLGAVGGQAPLAYFINSVGWRAAMAYIGYFGIALAVIFFFVVKDKPENQLDQHIVPSLKEISQGLGGLFKRAQPWLLSIFSGLAFAPVSVFGGLWGVSFLMEYSSLSHIEAAHVVSYIFIGFAVGAPLMGYLSDLLKSRKKLMVLGPFIALIFISVILFIEIRSLFWLSSLLFCFGFSISSFLLSFTMIREITAPILAATAIGFMNSFDALIGAVSDPLTGSILDFFWKGQLRNGARVFSIGAYQISLSTLPIFLIISLVVAYFIKDTYFSEKEYPNTLP